RYLSEHRRRRRPYRQRGGARQARLAQVGEALGAQHHADDAPGGHGHHAHAAQDGGRGEAATEEADHPRIQARGTDEGIRHLRQRGEREGAQGPARGWLVIPPRALCNSSARPWHVRCTPGSYTESGKCCEKACSFAECSHRSSTSEPMCSRRFDTPSTTASTLE